jgi:hypothetical protein
MIRLALACGLLLGCSSGSSLFPGPGSLPPRTLSTDTFGDKKPVAGVQAPCRSRRARH